MRSGFYKTIMLTKNHFQKIKDILGVELTKKNKVELQLVCNLYFIDRENPVSRPSETKKQLDAIQKSCELLLRAFQTADDFTASLLSMYHPKTITMLPELTKLAPEEVEIRKKFNTGLVKKIDELLENLIADLQIIEKAATKALKGLKSDKGGRPFNMELNSLLQHLQLIYEKITGKKATIVWNEYKKCSEGHFIDFVKVFLATIGRKDDIWSHEALATAIKRSLKRPSKSFLSKKTIPLGSKPPQKIPSYDYNI